MIGSSGTTSRPPFFVMAVPLTGALSIEKFGIRSRPCLGVTGSSQILWKRLCKTPGSSPLAPHQIRSLCGLHHRGASVADKRDITIPSVHLVIADPLPASAADALRAAGFTVDTKSGRKPDELANDLANADALIVRSATQVTAALIEASPKLR